MEENKIIVKMSSMCNLFVFKLSSSLFCFVLLNKQSTHKKSTKKENRKKQMNGTDNEIRTPVLEFSFRIIL